MTVQVGFRRRKAHATIAEGPERERLWQSVTSLYPRYLEYQTKTPRQIPVVVIT